MYASYRNHLSSSITKVRFIILVGGASTSSAQAATSATSLDVLQWQTNTFLLLSVQSCFLSIGLANGYSATLVVIDIDGASKSLISNTHLLDSSASEQMIFLGSWCHLVSRVPCSPESGAMTPPDPLAVKAPWQQGWYRTKQGCDGKQENPTP